MADEDSDVYRLQKRLTDLRAAVARVWAAETLPLPLRGGKALDQLQKLRRDVEAILPAYEVALVALEERE